MIKLYQGDCLEVMQGLEFADIGAVILDPPYGTGERLRVAGKFQKTKQPWDMWDASWRSAISDVPYAVFCPPKMVSQMLSSADRLLVWCTPCPVARKGVSPRYGVQSIVARGPFPTKYGLDWFKCSNNQKRVHPHEKPVKVIEWLIETMSKPGDTILDPFMGSGTTGVACVNTGRNFIGIEKDAGYFEIAKRRIEQTQSTLFEVAA